MCKTLNVLNAGLLVSVLQQTFKEQLLYPARGMVLGYSRLEGALMKPAHSAGFGASPGIKGEGEWRIRVRA